MYSTFYWLNPLKKIGFSDFADLFEKTRKNRDKANIHTRNWKFYRGKKKDTEESHLDIFYSPMFLMNRYWLWAGCGRLKAFQFQNRHESLISKYFPLKCELQSIVEIFIKDFKFWWEIHWFYVASENWIAFSMIHLDSW